MIERKAEGEEIVRAAGRGGAPAEVPDLMAALEASIKGAKRQSGGAKPSQEEGRSRSSSSNGAKSAKSKPRKQDRREEVVGRQAGCEVEVEGRRLRLSNLDKVLYPRSASPRAQVIDYYVRVAPVRAAAPGATAR